ncbi:MAG TPA: hypothetical protein VFV86_03150, partial [Nitrososphaeraceae archaeon]|nr:hypothetical protein [Nitrososphaeraceae archaeon]
MEKSWSIFLSLVPLVLISFIISISIIVINNNNIAFAHIFSSTPNSIFKEKDGYSVGFLPYPALPKVGDNNTLLNFNVQKNGNDITNTFMSLIIKDMATNKIIYQVPYKFHEFADITYSYTFPNQSKYSLSLLTKIAGDPKYENNPLIVSFEMDISNFSDMLLA